jgi:RNA polymerase sigma-70 factor, ECF subfamily
MDSTIDPTVALYAAPAVFADFYRAEFTSALALAMALTVSVADAEELVQDVFADAHRRWARVSRYDKPAAWVRRAIVNRSVSLKRRWLTRERAGLAQPGRSEIDARDNDLWAVVRSLPARQAQMVALVYVDGMSVAEAAALLKLAPSTASTHLNRAKERLQLDLADWKEPS